ncbi:peroxiredoxin family protein [Thermoflexibacter ruber]|nr:TlpA disulfide reductase family protein [Thermoflexibacter ruber]
MFYPTEVKQKLFEEKNQLGTPAHNFKVITIQGDTIELKNLKGKIVVINFFFAECPPCIAEIPDLNRIVNKYQTQEIIFLAISSSNDKERLKYLQALLLEKKGFEWQYTLCPAYDYETLGHSFKSSNRKIANELYMTNTYPTHIIIDKDGLFQYCTQGSGTDKLAIMEKTIDLLISK